jgi:serine protease Do
LTLIVCCLCTLAPAALASELRQTPIVRAVQSARGAVVNIRGEKTVVPPGYQIGVADPARRVNGMGTGVVIDSRGYIITNYHVVSGVRQIQVTAADGETLLARLIARDPETDLAIIKVDPPKPMQVIQIGTSSDLLPGETVIAVGNAYGYENTVTRGIISALHRAVQVSDSQFYDDLIQTDASINPGNSGGPLLNIDGQMIGVNVAVRAGAQGIGFAIPADKAMCVAAKLFAQQAGSDLQHGVTLDGDSSPSARGLTVSAVDKESPAAKGGLRPGDVITAVDGAEVHRKLDFQRALLDRKAGEKVQLAVRRASGPVAVQFTLAPAPAKTAATNDPAWETLGVELEQIPAEEFRKYQSRYRGGMMVKAIRPDSPAADQGIRPGDVLVGMHVWETVSMQNISYVINHPDLAELSPVKFFILRNKETLYGYLPVATKTAQRP